MHENVAPSTFYLVSFDSTAEKSSLFLPGKSSTLLLKREWGITLWLVSSLIHVLSPTCVEINPDPSSHSFNYYLIRFCLPPPASPRSVPKWFSRALWVLIPRTLKQFGRSTSSCVNQGMFTRDRASYHRTITGWTGSCGLLPSRFARLDFHVFF